jgi:hypothetical protein
MLPDFCDAIIVSKEVEEAEQYRCRLLHAQETPERPFAMELEDGLQVWRVSF